MIIRNGEMGDIEKCTDINVTIWGSKWKDTRYLTERVKKGELIVALDEKNNVIGYLAFRKKYWKENYFIEEMAVDTKHQGKGVGSALIKKLEALCVNENVRLFSSADSENALSISLHKKLDFSEVGFINNMFEEGKKEVIFSKKP